MICRGDEMGKEIERKFLLKDNTWKKNKKGVLYRQGYLQTDNDRVVRVRTMGEKARLTIKGITTHASRKEYEYSIPYDDAVEMMEGLCQKPLIEKIRYTVEYKNSIWEIDEFLGINLGLILAEVELKDENQSIEIPSWAGDEVTGQEKYFNSYLVKNPYINW